MYQTELFKDSVLRRKKEKDRKCVAPNTVSSGLKRQYVVMDLLLRRCIPTLLCCYMFLQYQVWWEFLSWVDAEFFQMAFLHLLRWSCDLWFLSCLRYITCRLLCGYGTTLASLNLASCAFLVLTDVTIAHPSGQSRNGVIVHASLLSVRSFTALPLVSLFSGHGLGLSSISCRDWHESPQPASPRPDFLVTLVLFVLAAESSGRRSDALLPH